MIVLKFIPFALPLLHILEKTSLKFYLHARAGIAASPLVRGAISAQYTGVSARAPAPPAPAAALAAHTPLAPHHAASDQLIWKK